MLGPADSQSGHDHMLDEEQIWQPFSGRPGWPILVMAAVVVTTYIAVFWAVFAGNLPLWGGVATNILLAYLAFTPMHEAIHGNVAAGRTELQGLETGMGWLCAVMLFGPFSSFKRYHQMHHQRTNHRATDPGFWVFGNSFWSVFVRCLTAQPHIYYLFIREDDFRDKWKRVGPTQLIVLGLVVVAAYYNVLATMLLLWVVPAWLATSLLSFVFDWLPHHPHQHSDRFRVARVLHLPGLQWLMVGHNYHLVHHLWPQVPFYHYRRLFLASRSLLQRQGSRVIEFGSADRSPLG